MAQFVPESIDYLWLHYLQVLTCLPGVGIAMVETHANKHFMVHCRWECKRQTFPLQINIVAVEL